MRALFLSNIDSEYGYCARGLKIGRAKLGRRNWTNCFTVLAAQSRIATQFSAGHIPSQKRCNFSPGLKKTCFTSSYSCPVTRHCLMDAPRFLLSAVVQGRSPMAVPASSSPSVSGGLLLNNRASSGRRDLARGKPAGVSFVGLCSRVKASMSLRLATGFFMAYLALNIRVPCALLVPSWRSSAAFSSRCYSNGAAPDVPVTDEQLGASADLPAKESTDQATLKLVSGSCYLPHPDKLKTGGEDAHFICDDKQVIGVADGVGGWANVGIDAGEYARELMSNAISSIKNNSKASIDPLRVLEKAYAATKSQGSSTACIIALTGQGIHAINLGDSGFVVIRDGSTVFQSPPQQYGFNFPYQLGSDAGANIPSHGQVFEFPVKAGDVIVVGTDGLFDNLYINEIAGIVVHATRVRLDSQVTAQKIAALAQERAKDQYRQTPFSALAQEAGHRYYGGKLDDITVVVSYVTDSS